MKIKNTFALIVSVIICELAGVIGSLFTAPAIPEWYAGLQKSTLNPPSWVFAPVWTTLFALMGVAAFLVWRRRAEHKSAKAALMVFAVQLVLNVLWSVIFFGQRNPGAAFAEIIVLWLAILAAIIMFFKVSRPAGWLLIPYILWVSFAGYLNFTVWQLQDAPSSFNNTAVSLPQGYTLDSYSIAEVLPASCNEAYECQTPFEYMIRSNCPYTSVCLNHHCTVVCPDYKSEQK